MKHVTLAFVCASALAVAAHAQSDPNDTPAPELTNTRCPVMPEEAVDPSFSTVYEGQTIYFCCKKCMVKFKADPEAYVANLTTGLLDAAFEQSAGAPAQVEIPAHEHTHPSDAGAPAEAPAAHTHDESAEPHDHAHHGDEAAGRFELLPYLGRFHVIAIHFPIALLLFAGFLESVSFFTRSYATQGTVRACVGFGAAGAVVSAALGLANAIGTSYAGVLSDVFWWHRALGITTAVLAVAAWFAIEHHRKTPSPTKQMVARSLIMLAALVVGLTGHLGGSLVYGWSYLMP